MVMGIEDWPSTDYREINEERLLASVRDVLGRQVMTLRSPPVIPDTARSNPFEQQSATGSVGKQSVYSQERSFSA
jgi:hypothetical protein